MQKFGDSIEEIFDKGLLFLIPFYIFSHEKRFEEYERDETKLELLKPTLKSPTRIHCGKI